jgi:hypothetical protein
VTPQPVESYPGDLLEDSDTEDDADDSCIHCGSQTARKCPECEARVCPPCAADEHGPETCRTGGLIIIGGEL